MSSIAYYDGVALFGAAVRCRHVPTANATQVATFFGINGVQAVDGGPRGRLFEIEGVWIASNPATFRSYEAVLLSYADGKPRTLVDTLGYTWPFVAFRGELQTGRIGVAAGGDWAMPFKCVLHGLL